MFFLLVRGLIDMAVKYSRSKVRTEKGEEWVFTKGRREALSKAQKVHVAYVKAGKRALGKS